MGRLVNSGGLEYKKLCARRCEYADMAAIFKKTSIFRKEMVVPEVEMGDGQLNMFAAYLLKATTENHYFLVYGRLQALYDRNPTVT